MKEAPNDSWERRFYLIAFKYIIVSSCTDYKSEFLQFMANMPPQHDISASGEA